MGCTHEIQQGGVVTVINAGGFAGGCGFCREAAALDEVRHLRAEVARLREALEDIRANACKVACYCCEWDVERVGIALSSPSEGQGSGT